jgi:hypothetical protein
MSQSQVMQRTESDQDSIIETFNEIAQSLRLPSLSWDFVKYEGETLVIGRPVAESDIAACPRWARFLGMSAVCPDTEDCFDSWLGVNGPWTLEIFAEVR